MSKKNVGDKTWKRIIYGRCCDETKDEVSKLRETGI